MTSPRGATLHRRGGVTLVELLVVLTILATMAAMAGLAFDAPSGARNPSMRDLIEATRRRAITSGRPATFDLHAGESAYRVVAMPDGRVLGAPTDSIDQLTGRAAHAAR